MDKSIQVIKIVSDQYIVINAGSDDGIRQKDVFTIWHEGKSVIDPFTNKNLGNLDTISATIEIIQLYPKMALCANAKYVSFQPSTIHTDYVHGVDRKPIRTYRDSLNVNPEDISGGLEDRLIKVGNRVTRKESTTPVSSTDIQEIAVEVSKILSKDIKSVTHMRP